MKKAVWIVALLAGAASLYFVAAQQQPGSVQAALVDLNGNRQNLGPLPGGTFAPRISPNGRQVVFDVGDTIWIADFPSLASRRQLPSRGQYPMWSGDGQRILFITFHNGQQALFWSGADGTGTPELLAESARAPEHWSTKSQSLTFITLDGSDYDIWRYSFVEKKPTRLIDAPQSIQHSSRISPDEKWIAYVSNETGRFEVFAQAFPPTGTKVRITNDGGEHPVWSPDGRQIYFDRAGGLYSVAIETGANIKPGAVTALPIKGFIQDVGRRQFELLPDGKRFLMLFPN